MENIETIEEAGERIRKELIYAPIGIIPNFNDGFIEGAKWQQERSYSDDEVFTIIDKAFHMYASSYRNDAKEWFEQFKKK